MKDKDKKNKKRGESTIGKIIYSFLLFMPLIAIGITCGYAMFNKNAYKSYSDKYINQYSQVNNDSLITENADYYVVYNNNSTAGNQTYDVNKTSLEDYITLQQNQYITRITFLNDNGIPRINYTLNDGTVSRIMNWQNVCPNFTFNLKEVIGNHYFNTVFTSLYLITYTIRSINDVFYYAVDKVTESSLFNWAENSIIYTTTESTCTALSITAPFIPLLLSYWLIISVMYFLYDIALMLVLIIHNRIHELQDTL